MEFCLTSSAHPGPAPGGVSTARAGCKYSHSSARGFSAFSFLQHEMRGTVRRRSSIPTLFSATAGPLLRTAAASPPPAADPRRYPAAEPGRRGAARAERHVAPRPSARPARSPWAVPPRPPTNYSPRPSSQRNAGGAPHDVPPSFAARSAARITRRPRCGRRHGQTLSERPPVWESPGGGGAGGRARGGGGAGAGVGVGP